MYGFFEILALDLKTKRYKILAWSSMSKKNSQNLQSSGWPPIKSLKNLPVSIKFSLDLKSA
jgi:hypothetical protein